MALAAQSGGFLTLLKKRNFLYLWLAQLISMTILNASNYALLVLIEKVTGSTTLVGVAIICFSLPAVLFGAPAGVFVDHMNKRRVLWGSNCLRAIATFLFVLALIVNYSILIPVYLLTLLISAIGQFFTPAEGASIPMLVNKEELAPALSLFNITFMLSQALGFILLAPIALSLLPDIQIYHLTFTSIEQLYTIVAVLYLVCALLITLIPKESFVQPVRGKNVTGPVTTETLHVMQNVWSEMVQGWSFIRRNKQLFLAVVQLSFAGVLLLVIGELATPIVTRLLVLPAASMAFVFAPAGIGLVSGSILIPRISSRMGKTRAIIIGIATLTIATPLLPLLTWLTRFLAPGNWVGNPLLLLGVALVMFAAGVALAFINVPAQTTMQEQTPAWIKGRVLALQLVLYNACSIPVILFIGAVADISGIDRVLYLLAICIAAFGGWGEYYRRKHTLIALPEMVQQVQTEREPDKILP